MAQRVDMTVVERLVPDKLRVSSFPGKVPTPYLDSIVNEPTPTSLERGCMRVQVQPATCTFGRMTGLAPLR